MMNAIPSRVTAAQFVRHFGEWQDRAAAEPIAITHHGRDRLVAMSATSYRALSQMADAAPGGNAAIDDGLIGRLSEGFIAFDRELRVIALNRIAATCLQIIAAEALGRQVPLEPTLCGQLERTLRTGEDAMVDTRSLGFAGRWLRYRCFPYGPGAACLLQDITDERAARQRLADDTMMTDALRAHGRIGRAGLSPRGTFVTIEPALAALVGFETDALIRRRLADILALDRRALAAGHLEDVLTGGAARAFDTSLLMRDGGQRPARIALAGGDDGAIAVIAAE